MTEPATKGLRIAFNVETMRPGCALLQAALVGNSALAHLFPIESWQLGPDGLHVYDVTEDQLEILVYRVNKSLGKVEEDTMKRGQKVWYRKGTTHVPVELVEFGRGLEATVKFTDGREKQVPKDRIVAKPPKEKET